MTLCCNCDMPIEIYWDWLQDQGWDCDELREQCDAVTDRPSYGVSYLYGVCTYNAYLTGDSMGYAVYDWDNQVGPCHERPLLLADFSIVYIQYGNGFCTNTGCGIYGEYGGNGR